MGTMRRLDEQTLVDELLAQFTEELRTSGHTNFDLLDRCPAGRQQELRSMMNMVALMHWAADRAAHRKAQAEPVAARRRTSW